MRAVSLHRDVLVVTSALLALNCVIVRGAAGGADAPDAGDEHAATFLIDSPILPEELDALQSLVAQAHFPAVSGLLVTHGDWDHLLAALAFPTLTLGAGEATVARLRARPAAAARELRDFDEQLMIERARPLTLAAIQALPVPGRCQLGEHELALHPAQGHTADGMAIVIDWARALVAGDYLSSAELPSFGDGGDLDAYLATLQRLRPLAAGAEHIIPGHGPILDAEHALAVLEQDIDYLRELAASGLDAQLPRGRDGPVHQRQHRLNVAALRAPSAPADGPSRPTPS